MKAWIYHFGGEYDNQSALVWAETRGKAQAKAADEIGCDFLDASVARQSSYDQYADDPEGLSKAQLRDGWWFYCWACGAMVTEENEQEDDESVVTYPDPVIDMYAVFCCQGCSDEWHSGREQAKARRKDALATLESRYPRFNIELDLSSGLGSMPVRAKIYFGGNSHADWGSDYPNHVLVCPDDVELWRKRAGCANPEEVGQKQ